MQVRNMIPNQSPGRGKRPSASSEECQHSEPNLNLYDVKWLAHPKKVSFQVAVNYFRLFQLFFEYSLQNSSPFIINFI